MRSERSRNVAESAKISGDLVFFFSPKIICPHHSSPGSRHLCEEGEANSAPLIGPTTQRSGLHFLELPAASRMDGRIADDVDNLSKAQLQRLVYGPLQQYVASSLKDKFAPGFGGGQHINVHDLLRILEHRNTLLVPRLKKGAVNWSCGETVALKAWIAALKVDPQPGGSLSDGPLAKAGARVSAVPNDPTAKADSDVPAAASRKAPPISAAQAPMTSQEMCALALTIGAEKDVVAWKEASSACWGKRALDGEAFEEAIGEIYARVFNNQRGRVLGETILGALPWSCYAPLVRGGASCNCRSKAADAGCEHGNAACEMATSCWRGLMLATAKQAARMTAKTFVENSDGVAEYDKQAMRGCVAMHLNGTLFQGQLDASEGPFASIMQCALESAELAAQTALNGLRSASLGMAGHTALLARMVKEPTEGAQKLRDRETVKTGKKVKRVKQGKTRSKRGKSKTGSSSRSSSKSSSKSSSRSSSRSSSGRGLLLRPAGISKPKPKPRPRFVMRPRCINELAAKVTGLKTALVAMTGESVLPKIAAVRAACNWKLGAIGNRFNSIYNGLRFCIHSAEPPKNAES